jgi:hypothetical protein
VSGFDSVDGLDAFQTLNQMNRWNDINPSNLVCIDFVCTNLVGVNFVCITVEATVKTIQLEWSRIVLAFLIVGLLSFCLPYPGLPDLTTVLRESLTALKPLTQSRN